YNNVTIGAENQAWALWTDARNGRSARQQPGRNPICEQSDAFGDRYNAHDAPGDVARATKNLDLYLVTACPLAMQEKGTKSPPRPGRCGQPSRTPAAMSSPI